MSLQQCITKFIPLPHSREWAGNVVQNKEMLTVKPKCPLLIKAISKKDALAE
jgi:hypothetical protein